MSARTQELKVRHAARGVCVGVIVSCVLDVCLYAVVLPAWLPVIAVVATVMIILAVFGVRRQTRRIRKLRQPAVAIWNGPESVPPLKSMPLVALGSPSTGLAVAGLLAGGGFMSAAAPCTHSDAFPVEQPAVLGGETVAWLCPECGDQLTLEWAAESGAGRRLAQAEALTAMWISIGRLELNAGRARLPPPPVA